VEMATASIVASVWIVGDWAPFGRTQSSTEFHSIEDPLLPLWAFWQPSLQWSCVLLTLLALVVYDLVWWTIGYLFDGPVPN